MLACKLVFRDLKKRRLEVPPLEKPPNVRRGGPFNHQIRSDVLDALEVLIEIEKEAERRVTKVGLVEEALLDLLRKYAEKH